MNAIEAASYIDIIQREDFKNALRTTLITSNKFIPVFDQLFDIYWRNPDRLENVSDILRKLYESRLAQEGWESMKQQTEELQYKRAESFKPREEEETEKE